MAVNKGDATTPLIRSRFVVKEIATYKTDDFFAATPPLEASRLLLSLAASGAQDTKIEVLDARKAHLHLSLIQISEPTRPYQR